jgi:hypothetical protein
MRKSAETQRFQNSALLFKFCLRVYEAKSPDKKVHDQEIGNILNYNPSDTSHWKRGKKSVKSIYAHEALSKALEVDLEIIQDLSEGVLDADEAWFDYQETMESQRLEEQLSGPLKTERAARKMFYQSLAKQLLEKASISTTPVHIPEISSLFPFIQIVAGEVADKIARSSRVKANQYCIRYRKGEMRPHTRLAIAREIAKVVIYSERESFQLPPLITELVSCEVQDFAHSLLVPSSLLRNEILNCNTKSHIVKSLADFFWVPKRTMRICLRDLIVGQGTSDINFQAPLTLVPYGNLGHSQNPNDLSEDDTAH